MLLYRSLWFCRNASFVRVSATYYAMYSVSGAYAFGDSRADVNALAIDKKMPLHFAAEKGHAKILRFLLENGFGFCKKTPHSISSSNCLLQCAWTYRLCVAQKSSNLLALECTEGPHGGMLVRISACPVVCHVPHYLSSIVIPVFLNDTVLHAPNLQQYEQVVKILLEFRASTLLKTKAKVSHCALAALYYLHYIIFFLWWRSCVWPDVFGPCTYALTIVSSNI